MEETTFQLLNQTMDNVEFVQSSPSNNPAGPSNPLKYKDNFGRHHTKMFPGKENAIRMKNYAFVMLQCKFDLRM